MNEPKINVLVADDSQVARMLLVHVLESDPQIRVLGVVNDGQAALDFLQAHKPDVIVMDIHMPRMDGFEATRRIMETLPLPIVICSGTTDPHEVATTFRVLEAGAVACVEKPVTREHPDFESLAANLRQTVRLMSEVKVVRRWPRSRLAEGTETLKRTGPIKLKAGGVRFIGMGASTGGPPVLQTILTGLARDLPAPVLIVQHIARGFLPGFVEWLGQTTGWPIHIAGHGMAPLPGHAYLAPDDFHMGLAPNGRLFLSREEPVGGLRPSVGYLFRTLVDTCGAQAVGVLLTGMGRDGAMELKMMRDAGADTIAQNRETSVVHGMPGEAIALGGAVHVLSPEQIAAAILAVVRRRTPSGGIEP